MMEVELSARDIATLEIEVECAVARFGIVQDGGIDRFVEVKAIFIDHCIPNVDLAQKHFCVSLSGLHHPEKATGDTERGVVLAICKTRWHRVLCVLTRHVKHSHTTTTERFDNAPQQSLERSSRYNLLACFIANMFSWILRVLHG